MAGKMIVQSFKNVQLAMHFLSRRSGYSPVLLKSCNLE